ncbi:ribosome assembly factor SBDS [Candidatus Woesearchaeota archaeon]|nr:ribosome assembly factor SBDS [Candidatus Woesearchaeota archaeon]
MPNGRSQRDVIKERISINLARLKKGGENFEIIIQDPDKALEFRQGNDNISMRDILEIDKIFKDAKKGEAQSPDAIKKWLGTEKASEAAKKILREGEFHLTAEQRKRMFEEKKKKLIDHIHRNAADPKTGNPHPVKRIELAMEEAKVQIDPYTPIRAQMDKIIEQLRPIIPLSFEKIKLRIRIPAKYAGSGYGNIKSKYTLKNEEWKNDGSVEFEMEIPAGIKPDIYNIVNKLTNGEATIEEMK